MVLFNEGELESVVMSWLPERVDAGTAWTILGLRRRRIEAVDRRMARVMCIFRQGVLFSAEPSDQIVFSGRGSFQHLGIMGK